MSPRGPRKKLYGSRFLKPRARRKSGARITGILPNATVTVVDVRWIGSTAVALTYKAPSGQVANQLLYRDHEPAFELVAAGIPWAFREHPEGLLWMALSETRRADREGRMKKSRGAHFKEAVKRLVAPRAEGREG
jgi:hypothetical protein